MAYLQLLFTDDLAQAIAEGRKYVTRRPITRQNSTVDGWPWPREPRPEELCGPAWSKMDWADVVHDRIGDDRYLKVAMPHPEDPEDDGTPSRTRHRVYSRAQVGHLLVIRECWREGPDGTTVYRGEARAQGEDVSAAKWRPAIHMPRARARSIRVITAVVPERFNPATIGRDEARDEGFDSPAAFEFAWTAMYGSATTWVWRIDFEGCNR